MPTSRKNSRWIDPQPSHRSKHHTMSPNTATAPTPEPKAELAFLLPPITAIQLFETGGVRTILDKIKAEAKSIVTDPTTEAGRKEIKSLAYKIAQTKTAMDEMGKSLTEEQREFIARINAERKTIVTELDELKEEIRRPVTEYEAREKRRIEAHEAIITQAIEAARPAEGMNSAAVAELIAKTESWDTSGLEEFTTRAETEKSAALHRLGKLRDELAAKEAEAARIEAERLAAEEKARQEREAKIAAEAAEKARLEAEAEAKRIAEVEAARVAEEARKAEEAREAERKAEAERIAAAEREKAETERLAKEAAERAERERIETEERHKREIAEAQARAEREAAEKEKARLEAIAAEKAAEEKRAANAKHRRQILAEIAADLSTALHLEDELAGTVALALAEGKIRHVSIQF
jgi:colicin import membrane protein